MRRESGIDRYLPRMHPVALGLAVGTTAGAGLFLLTLFHLLSGQIGLRLTLLSWYFPGYDVSWRGAFIGFAWALGCGFAVGWLLAVVHGFWLRTWWSFLKARADLTRSRNVIDQLR